MLLDILQRQQCLYPKSMYFFSQCTKIEFETIRFLLHTSYRTSQQLKKKNKEEKNSEDMGY